MDAKDNPQQPYSFSAQCRAVMLNAYERNAIGVYSGLGDELSEGRGISECGVTRGRYLDPRLVDR